MATSLLQSRNPINEKDRCIPPTRLLSNAAYLLHLSSPFPSQRRAITPIAYLEAIKILPLTSPCSMQVYRICNLHVLATAARWYQLHYIGQWKDTETSTSRPEKLMSASTICVRDRCFRRNHQ